MAISVRLIKLSLLLAAALVASGNAAVNERSGRSKEFHAKDGVDGSTTVRHHQHQSLVNAAEEFIDFEAELLKRRLQVTESSYCNTWCMLKNSLGLTIIGLILICISPCMMWRNEGRHVKELRRIDFCKNKAVVIDNANVPSDENTGSLVHFVGKVSVDDNTLDFTSGGPLNISTPLTKALIIKRTCFIYQKFEESSQQKKNDMIGAGQTTTTTFTIKEDWTNKGPQGQLPHYPNEFNSRGTWDELVSASGSPETAEQNSPAKSPNLPPQFAKLAEMLKQVDLSKAPHGISVSKAAHVGGFRLSSDIILEEKVRVFSSAANTLLGLHIPHLIILVFFFRLPSSQSGNQFRQNSPLTKLNPFQTCKRIVLAISPQLRKEVSQQMVMSW